MRRPVLVIADADRWLQQRWATCRGEQSAPVVDASDREALAHAVKHVSSDGLLLADTTSCRDPEWLDIVHSVRAGSPRRAAVVTVVTHSSEERVIAALRAGVDDYLRRPFDTGELRYWLETEMDGEVELVRTETLANEGEPEDQLSVLDFGLSIPEGELERLEREIQREFPLFELPGSLRIAVRD